MVRNYYIITIALLLFVGCAARKDLMIGAEDTAASKTIAQLTPIGAAPAEGNQLIIDQSGITKNVTALNLMRSLETALTSYAIENDNLDDSITKSGASCDFYTDGSALTVGMQFRFRVPFLHTLSKVIITTEENLGDIEIDVWIDEAGATTGLDNVTSVDSVFNTYYTAHSNTNPTMDAAVDQYQEFISSDFDAGEYTSIPAGSYYVVNVDDVTTLTRCSVDLEFIRED